MQTKVTLIDNSSAWLKQEEARLQTGLGRVAQAILATARVRVPRKDGNLANTGRVSGTGNEREISFGGQGVKYAHAQEKGTNGKVVFRNYTTPGTGKQYLEKAGEQIAKKGIKPYLPS